MSPQNSTGCRLKSVCYNCYHATTDSLSKVNLVERCGGKPARTSQKHQRGESKWNSQEHVLLQTTDRERSNCRKVKLERTLSMEDSNAHLNSNGKDWGQGRDRQGQRRVGLGQHRSCVWECKEQGNCRDERECVGKTHWPWCVSGLREGRGGHKRWWRGP